MNEQFLNNKLEFYVLGIWLSRLNTIIEDNS